MVFAQGFGVGFQELLILVLLCFCPLVIGTGVVAAVILLAKRK